MFRLNDGFSEAYRQIKDDFNSTVSQLHDAIAVIASATREVADHDRRNLVEHHRFVAAHRGTGGEP